VLLAAWTIVTSRTFAGAALQRLTFAEALGLCALGLIGLIAHEVIIERALARPAGAVSENRRASTHREVASPEPSRVAAW
jgi:hypothetical protein